MLQRLQKKWGVNGSQFFWILLVFAITGTATAYFTKVITGWAGFDNNTPWLYKALLRLGMLVIGYQLILLTVAALLGQFRFFWAYEKKILRWLKIIPKEKTVRATHRLAIFASGAGSNAQKIIDHFRFHQSVQVALIVSNKPDAGVLAIARQEKIPVLIIEKDRFFRGDGYVPSLEAHEITFIVLAKFR